MTALLSVAEDFRSSVCGEFGTILADPPWQFSNRTGKIAPEHRRLARYTTLDLEEIASIPVFSRPRLAKTRKTPSTRFTSTDSTTH